jgi:cytochrome c oxidase assembly protein subunit 15|tara:strand:- start:3078 stop:4055 length:978 start_codon:yes stop_codon:yes gene_type:complete
MIIATGAWIRVNDAGESCPDWPQCFGTWTFDVSEEEQAAYWEEHPDEIDSRGAEHRYTSYQIFTEWFHRLLVGIIGFIVIYSHYTAWSLREEIGNRVHQLHSISTFLLILQAVVGAITVDLDNAPWTVAIHLSLALFFTSSLIAVGLYWWEKQSKLPENVFVPNVAVPELRKIIGIVGLIVLGQLIVGAFLSSGYHRGACGIGFMDGWPLCGGRIIPEFNQAGVGIQFIHRTLAIVISGILFWANSKVKAKVGRSVVTILMHSALGLYNVNLLLGGWYIISAGDTESVFSSHIGIAHSLLGSLTFLILIAIYFIFVISIQRTEKA